VFDALLLVAGVVWLYFWLRGNWFAGFLAMPIGACIFLTLRAWSVPPGAPFTAWHWLGLLACAGTIPGLPILIKSGLAEDRARKNMNVRGITLIKQNDTRPNWLRSADQWIADRIRIGVQ
jgi:hypothetical protein